MIRFEFQFREIPLFSFPFIVNQANQYTLLQTKGQKKNTGIFIAAIQLIEELYHREDHHPNFLRSENCSPLQQKPYVHPLNQEIETNKLFTHDYEKGVEKQMHRRIQ